MAYADLTPEQQQAIQAVMQIVRPSIGDIQRTVHVWEQVLSAYDTSLNDFRVALNLLVSNDTIPNVSGLAGASAVTKAQLVNPVGGIFADMRAVVMTWREVSRLALCVQLAGINAE